MAFISRSTYERRESQRSRYMQSVPGLLFFLLYVQNCRWAYDAVFLFCPQRRPDGILILRAIEFDENLSNFVQWFTLRRRLPVCLLREKPQNLVMTYCIPSSLFPAPCFPKMALFFFSVALLEWTVPSRNDLPRELQEARYPAPVQARPRLLHSRHFLVVSPWRPALAENRVLAVQQ